MTKVTNNYNTNNSKNDSVVDTEDWRLTMNVYVMEYDNNTRDKR